MGTGIDRQKGYSLVELMVAMVLAMLATVAIYKGFVSFRVAADVQEQEVEIQQGLRVGMQRMLKELRMIGYNPTGQATAGFITANAVSVSFSADYNQDGDIADSNVDCDSDGTNNVFCDEQVAYSWNGTQGAPLVRTDLNVGSPAGDVVVVPHVSMLQFLYYDDSSPPLVPATSDAIRSIEIALVVRPANEDFSYTNTRNYTNIQGATIYTPGANDHFRRQQITARVKPRNMGLN